MLSQVLALVYVGLSLAHPQTIPPFANTTTSGWVIGQAVRTSSGLIRGHEAYWPEKSGVSEYLGIRYGEPPVGPLRFRAPRLYHSNETRNAVWFADECWQTVGPLAKELNGPKIASLGLPQDLINFGKALAGGVNGNLTYSEDCLNLNVWTKPQTGEKNKAVLLWIYGGASSVGASSAQYYNPARYAAEHDIVAVSINYRLNIYGFPMAEFMEEQNAGLLDQRLAIEWVRDNIAQFGGDPKRITIFGESAGGAAVDYYTYAWTKDPIVNGFISQSGTAAGLPGDPPNSKSWFVVSKAVGCGDASTDDGKKSLACMRNKTTEEIAKGIDKLGPVGGVSSILSFWPVADGKVIFADIWDRQAKGQFIKRPMIQTNMDHEGNLIVGAMQAGIDWALKQTDPNTVKIGNQIKDVFNFVKDGTGSTADLTRFMLKFVEDSIFNCPAWQAAKGRADNNVPIWRARFMGDWKNLALAGWGAYHVSDVPMVMGTTMRKRGATANEPEQEKMINNIMGAWAAFAKDPDHGLEKLGWPKYDVKGNTLIRLGYNNSGTPDFGPAEEYDKNCPSLLHVGPEAYAPVKKAQGLYGRSLPLLTALVEAMQEQ